MSAVDIIQKVLDSDLLSSQFMLVPERGATDEEIYQEQARLGFRLCEDHLSILRRWNGIDLEIIRLYGCGDNTGEIASIAAQQRVGYVDSDDAIAIGSDAAGFIYLQSANRHVYAVDSRSGELKPAAADLEELFERLIFGADAESFAGAEWAAELRQAGFLN